MSREAHARSYYAATAHPAPDRPQLAESMNVDVCIVGGGFTGVSAALELAERGFDVVLLEVNRIGWGASGRNGGQICSAFSCDMDKVAAWVGPEDAGKLFRLAEEAKNIIRQRVDRHNIDCALKWGYLHAAERARDLREVDDWAAQWARDYGYRGLRVLREDEVGDYVGSPRYRGGLFDPGAGHLHPLNYCLGLAAAAEAAGARLFEGTRATAIEQGARPVVRTARGSVTARFLVVACNAYLDDLVPEIRRKIMPVGTYVGATAPLGEARAKRLIPQDHAVADLRFVLNYFRLSEDRRLLFGGLVSYTTLPPANLSRAIGREMRRVFPELTDVGFDYTWGGFVAITMERSPHLGRLAPNLYFAQGYSGTGVTLSGIAARVIAEAIAGQAERLDVFARLPHTTFPGGPLLRTPTLALAMTWYRLRDLLP